MLKEMLNADTMFDFALFESGINELLSETNHIDLYMRATDFQAALNVAALTDRLDEFFESIGCVEMDTMVYNVSHAYYTDPSDENSITQMKAAVQECFRYYSTNYQSNYIAGLEYIKANIKILLNATDWEVLADKALYFLQEVIHLKKFSRITPDIDKQYHNICDCLTTCYYIYSRLSDNPTELCKQALFANSDCETAFDLMKHQLRKLLSLVENN